MDCDEIPDDDAGISDMRGAGREAGLARGREEGLTLGRAEGEKRGSELGFYKGFTVTWIHLLQSSTPTTKILNKLNEVLELVDSFPKTNEKSLEQSLSTIRLKFKQSTLLLDKMN